MSTRRARTLIASLLLLAGLGGAANAQPMTLAVQGGGLGQALTLTLTGPPSAQYLLLLSLTTGPSALPPPHIPSLDVGLELIDFAVSIPGFLGVLPPSGTLALPLPIPALPALDNLNLNFQSLRIANGIIKEKSNLWRVTFDTPGEYAFTLTGLNQARAFSTCNSLPDGTVLVAGGGTGSITGAQGLATAERYLPSIEKFDQLAPMNSARALHRSARLADGRVLLTGGVDSLGIPLASAEIFDPAAGTFTPVGSMALSRVGHTATALSNGTVLVVGGSSSLADATAFLTSCTPTTEIFDPNTNTFSPGPPLPSPRTFHDAIRMPSNDKVLVTGGLTVIIFILPIPDFSAAAHVFNAAGTAIEANPAGLSKRAAHTSVALADGRVLIVGGGSGTVLMPTILNTCHIFNPATNAFTAVVGNLVSARAITGLVRLPDGRVLASGGALGDLLAPTSMQSCEIYSPGTNLWTSAGSMQISRSGHGALLLPDNSVALIGGAGGPGNAALATAEIFQP